MTYLLDANVLSYVLNAGRWDDLADCSRDLPLAIVGEVRDEILAHRTLGALFGRRLPESAIGVRELLVGSREHALLLELHPDPAMPRGKGERASIALAAHDASLIFVANDKNAMWIALRELHFPGERMIGVPVFLRRLVEVGFPGSAADDVLRACGAPTPTWWRDFRVGVV